MTCHVALRRGREERRLPGRCEACGCALVTPPDPAGANLCAACAADAERAQAAQAPAEPVPQG